MVELEPVKCRARDLEHDAAGVVDDLAGDIEETASERVRVSGLWHDRCSDVCLEGFEQRKGQERRVVVRGVLAKPLEGQPLIDGDASRAAPTLASARGDE